MTRAIRHRRSPNLTAAIEAAKDSGLCYEYSNALGFVRFQFQYYLGGKIIGWDRYEVTCSVEQYKRIQRFLMRHVDYHEPSIVLDIVKLVLECQPIPKGQRKG